MGWGSVIITENPVVGSIPYHMNLPLDRIANLSVTHRDQGGMWSASFELIPASRAELLQFLHSGLGRNVEVFDDTGRKNWEGFVNTVELNTGVARFSNSLNDVGNKVWARYTAVGGASVLRSTVYQKAASQAQLGIKEMVLSAGEVSAAVAAQFASNYLDLIYSPTPNLDGIDTSATLLGQPQLAVKCLGYVKTLGWRVYNQTASAGTDTAQNVITAIVTACGQFVKTKYVGPNDTSVTKEYDQDRKADDIIDSIAQLGDANKYAWVWGMEADRHFYYRPASPAIRPTSA